MERGKRRKTNSIARGSTSFRLGVSAGAPADSSLKLDGEVPSDLVVSSSVITSFFQ